MKTKINLFIFLFIGCISFSQSTKCDKFDNMNKKIDCLEKQIAYYQGDNRSENRFNPYIITLNYKNRKEGFKLPKNIKEGDFYVIEVDSINMNLFDITTTSKDTILSKALKTPTFEDISFSNLSSLVGSFKTAVDSIVNVSEGVNQKDANEYINLEINTNCVKLGQDIHLADTSIESLLTEIEAQKTIWRKEKVAVYEYKLHLLKAESTGSNETYLELFSKTEGIRSELDGIREKLLKTKGVTQNKLADEKNKKCFEINKPLKQQYEATIKRIDTINSKIIAFKEVLNADKVMALVMSVHFLKHENENSYTSLPIQFNGEYTTVNLKITPKEAEYNEQTYETKFTFPLKRKDWYLSIGTSFYVSGLNNERFSTLGQVQDDDSTIYSIVEEKNDKQELGIATLLKYGKVLSDTYNLGGHLSFGPGINIDSTVRPRLLLGAGITIGKKHCFSIDVGGIAGYVDRASTIVNLDNEFAMQPENLTVTQLKFDKFLAIGYLFKL